jgi:hypothetical protein
MNHGFPDQLFKPAALPRDHRDQWLITAFLGWPIDPMVYKWGADHRRLALHHRHRGMARWRASLGGGLPHLWEYR